MLPTDQGRSRVSEFLADMNKKPKPARGNLIFSIDATGSREETWDMATHLQTQMFHEVAAIGALDVQLVYFRGVARIDGECRASNWLSDPVKLAAYMSGIRCRAGLTQISRVLDHTLHEASQRKISAMIYVGDCCEESRDHLATRSPACRYRDSNFHISRGPRPRSRGDLP